MTGDHLYGQAVETSRRHRSRESALTATSSLTTIAPRAVLRGYEPREFTEDVKLNQLKYRSSFWKQDPG